MVNKNNKVYVEWSDVEAFVKEVASKFETKPTGVYGLPRGGLCMATLLSYYMNIPLLMAPVDGCIIIDDIADSGKSLCHYTENDTQFNKYYITTLFYKKRSIVTPNFYKFVKNDEWIVFPWEMED